MISDCDVPILEISYEAMVRQPQKTIDTVGDFCGVRIGTKVSLEKVPISKQNDLNFSAKDQTCNGTKGKKVKFVKPLHDIKAKDRSSDHTADQGKPLSLLLATNHLFTYTGSEITLFTIAKILRKKGHKIAVYAKYTDPNFIKLFNGIAEVTNDIRQIEGKAFNAAYVQHHPIAMEVRYSFPTLPIILASLGVLPFLEQPPIIDLGVYKYLAISEEVKNNLIKRGVSKSRIQIFRNVVDSKKYYPTRIISSRPEAAIIYSYKINNAKAAIIFEACGRLGIKCQHIGKQPGSISQIKVADEINKVDLVFTLGRGAIETMMCGKIPFVYDIHGGDGMVNPHNLHELMTHNFSGRRYRKEYSVDEMVSEIKAYDAQNADKLRELAIHHFDANQKVDNLLEVIKRVVSAPPVGRIEERNVSLKSLLDLINTTKNFAETNASKHKTICSYAEEKVNTPIIKVRKEESCVNSLIHRVVRPIAFYLPQYHPIPENDRWWGKGFTEWTNVSKAVPLYHGHYQPHRPADLGFYDLRIPEVRAAQAELAKEFGIYGFCYYHYWFNGKPLLERPLQEVLDTGEPDFPFCLCWANENWTRKWDGGSDKILIAQNYLPEDDLAHIRMLCRIFQDRRYICVDGKPLFLVYRANRLPDPNKTIDIWRKEAIKLGLGELYICRVESFPDEHSNPKSIGFDAAVEFQPDWKNINNHMRDERYPHLNGFKYERVVEGMLNKMPANYKRFPCVCPSWDNTPRRGQQAVFLSDSSPELYRYWIEEQLKAFNPPSKFENFLFINAWNEWGEGNHLEPDQRHGRAYLRATRKALFSWSNRKLLNPTPERPESRHSSNKAVLVSIIIPVLNQVHYTRMCLKSIEANSTSGTYEIIFIDNGSTDGTVEYLQQLDGRCRTIANTENRGFAKACNQGAEIASGEYLIFLNNDTEPLPGWLDSLVGVANAHPNAGAVGAKLIYPDGSLQEAGAVIFSDGSGYNFGRGNDPSHPAYNKLCEVDYCSGACLLVRRRIFESLGGFDDSFSPAYYEDTDLCFGIRKLGYVVLYDPNASVIHHESVTSNSRDSAGAKAYLKINRNKFVAKWAAELALQDSPPRISGKLPATASRKRLNAPKIAPAALPAKASKQVIVFYPHNPWPPRTGSHRRCISMLQAFKSLGMSVHLVSSTAFTDRPWSGSSQKALMDEYNVSSSVYSPVERDLATLGQMSSPRYLDFSGKFKLDGLERFFKENIQDLNPDIVLVNYAYWGNLARGLSPKRPIKIIEMHDLVTVNDQMRKLVSEQIGNPPFPDDSPAVDKDLFRGRNFRPHQSELDVYDEFDLVLAISEKEAEVARRGVKNAVVETLPMAFDSVSVNNTYGGSPVFVISPNLFNFQGYLFLFGAIMPLVLQGRSSFEVTTIGDGCRFLRPFAGARLKGYQADLKPYYAQAPFAVCPLVGGTGQQVKIVEAMAHGVPVIAMKNVAESSPIVHGENGYIAEDAESFAYWMQACLGDRVLCRKLGQSARETIQRNFSQQKFEEKLANILKGIAVSKPKASASTAADRSRSTDANPTVHRILWIRTDAIGDNILAAGTLPQLKRKYPEGEITVLCQDHIGELYEPSPYVDKIIRFNRRRALNDSAYRNETASRLAALRADLALNSVYSREALTDFFAISSRAREIVGFEGDLCNISPADRERTNCSYTRLVSSPEGTAPELKRHRDFLAALDIAPALVEPLTWLTEDDEAYAEKIFAEKGFDPERTIGLFIGAQAKLRHYPHYAKALTPVCRDRRLQVIALGAAADARINDACLRKLGVPSLNLGGKTSLRQAAAVLKRCRLGVGAETGTAHMACAVGTPNVVLVGGGHFGRFMPYSPLTTMACLPLECYGCNWHCRYATPHCVQNVDPNILGQAVSAALDSGASHPSVFLQGQDDWTPAAGRPRWQWPPAAELPSDLRVHFVGSKRRSEPAAIHAAKTDASLTPPHTVCRTNGIADEHNSTARSRSELANALLQANAQPLSRLHEGPAGAVFRSFLDSSTKDLPVSEEDWRILSLLRADAGNETGNGKRLRQLMAAMLYLYPHQMPLGIGPSEIPAWFQADYFRFLVTRPECFQVPGEIEQYQRHMAQLVSELHRQLCAHPENDRWHRLAETFSKSADFLPLYFSRAELRRLYEKRAAIVEAVLARKVGTLDHQFRMRDSRSAKIKFGVYLPVVANHTETFATLPVFQCLDREAFEIRLYVHRRSGDPIETSAQQQVDRFVILPEAVRPAVKVIRQDDLDILFFGTNLTANQGCGYMLASHRLARRQCIHFCSPVTSGLRHMDYFLLGDLAAPKETAEEQFSERILRIDGSGICFALQPQTLSGKGGRFRLELGVDPERVVFVSGANFFKITPELVEIWSRILLSVPESMLILYPFGPAWSNRYPKNLFIGNCRRLLADQALDPARLLVLDALPNRSDILDLLQSADVYLDALPYNGATSLLDPLAVGVPPVVLEGNQLRFRQGAAIIRELGIPELIARTEREYVDLAVALGRDDRRRTGLRRAILDKMSAGPPFLDSRRFGARIGAAFKKMVADFDSGRLRMAG